MIKKTTISLLTIFFALNTAVVLAAGSGPSGMAQEDQSETMSPSNNASKGTKEKVMGNNANTDTTTTQTTTTQSETTDQKDDKKQTKLATDSQNVGTQTTNGDTAGNNQSQTINNISASESALDEKQAYDDAKATEQSKANRLLTSASTAATGIGGMELAQGLAEQKADKAADADMSAYISTMRCSYGSGKSVKAGTEEIELPGGNSANLMQYRSEYVALASDLKERKNALDMTPGIESEEILDKSQMGLYDDENVGITGGRYASLYRAQMLGSESDQAQLDEAKQTSKTRVIGGAVAAGVGVVGGIVGDELINQSLSSSTKTAQTCTESGGTWQGARCHCPDGFIQHTKTGPCFEEKPTEVQTTTKQQTPVNQGNPTPPQDNNQDLSSGGNGDGNGQSGGISDDNNDAGGSDEKGDSSIVNIADISFEEDEFESAEFDETADAAVIEYEKSEMCRKFDGNWQNGKCLCTNSFTSNQYIECVQDTNAPTVTISAPMTTTAGIITNSSTNIDDTSSSTTTSITGSNDPQQKTGGNTPAAVATTQHSNSSNLETTITASQTKATCGVVGKKECNSNYYICESDKDCTNDKLPANATAGRCWKGDGRSVCTATACKDTHEVSQGHCVKKKVVERNDSAKSSTSTAQRPNTTEATKTNTEQKKTLVELIGKNNLNADPTNWRAKMNNGTTAFCEVKGDFMKAKMEKCSGLGEWWWDAKFSYGTIQGKSKCTKNSNTGSQTCYCYVSRYTNNNGKTYTFTQSQSERVNSYTGAGSAGYECAASCPKYCAQTAMSDYPKRQNIFNKSGVHQ